MKKRAWILIAVLLVQLFAFPAAAAEPQQNEQEVRILFTHDMHDYYEPTEAVINGVRREHGGIARLSAMLQANWDENTIYVDAGDFAMGTLMQAAYATDAFELRLMGQTGCAITTLGNHEFDYGAQGTADMLLAAVASGDPLPELLIPANLDFSGELTADQQLLKDALEIYGAQRFYVREINGVRLAFFGLLGEEAVEDSPTSGQVWRNFIDAAKEITAEIGDSADIIVCLSHSGTTGDGISGEDFELAKQVPGIDIVISAHSHTVYDQSVVVNDTIVGSCGYYNLFLGRLDIRVSGGDVVSHSYELLPIDENSAEDSALAETVAEYRRQVEQMYLGAENVAYDQVIARSDYDFMTLDEMYASHQEYPLGDLIADSYLYEAGQNGIRDIDVALVGLGTIRGSILQGDVTVADAFEICSLGVGEDGSAGHPLLSGYITGRELKLLCELDASLGPVVSSIKMSYAGLSYTFNTERMILDRVTDICIVRPDGSREPVENNRLYKVCCNMYSANMLGMVNDLTKGILSITPKDADGNEISDLSAYTLRNGSGAEIKEWIALKNYLMSFDPGKDGVPHIPEEYSATQGRKVRTSEGGLAVLAHPGMVTLIVAGLVLLVIVIVLLLVWLIVRIVRRRQRRKK